MFCKFLELARNKPRLLLVMPRDLTFTATPAATGTGGWQDGVPMSAAQAARARIAHSQAVLGDSSTRPGVDWKSQPLGGRASIDVAAASAPNPFESRLLASSPKSAARAPQRMHGQHDMAMTSLHEFAGAAGVASSRVAGALEHQGPPKFRAAHTTHANAAGTPAPSKEYAMFHGGSPSRRVIADEGTMRTNALHGAAVIDLGSR